MRGKGQRTDDRGQISEVREGENRNSEIGKRIEERAEG